jgi:hypothetical protein
MIMKTYSLRSGALPRKGGASSSCRGTAGYVLLRQVCAQGRHARAGRAQGVLERVARHSKRVATGVLHVAHAWPTKVADALVARLGGRATLVQDELAPGQPLATRRGAAKEVACASVLAVVDVCVPRPAPALCSACERALEEPRANPMFRPDKSGDASCLGVVAVVYIALLNSVVNVLFHTWL